jgi:hypothetical protein
MGISLLKIKLIDLTLKNQNINQNHNIEIIIMKCERISLRF